MVMVKRAAVAAAAEAGTGRFAGRLRPFDVAVDARARELMQFRAARRVDQHSTVSIAGSGSRLGVASSGRSTLPRGSGDDSNPHFAAANTRRRHPQTARPRRSAKGGYGSDSSGSGGDIDRFHYLHKTCGASNSAAAVADGAYSPDCVTGRSAAGDTIAGRYSAAGWRHSRSSRRSYGTHRQGKTVSITASQDARTRSDIDRTASSRVYLPHDMATKSIIKLRPLSGLHGGHNEDAPMREVKTETGLTPHQLRDQKIFGECRFVPHDTFYKKVIVAPNDDRQFFASPRCSRVPGSRMLYDIANQNSRHHQDCNFDSTRDMLRRACSTYYRPSQFRHIY